jgi:hypothetical protein
LNRSALILASVLLAPAALAQQQPITLKTTVVALASDQQVRTDFEDGLVEKARAHSYDVVASHTIVADTRELDENAFMRQLADRGIQAVLMLRPAAIGEGSSLESVRNEVSPKLFSDMQRFAKRVSTSGPDDLIAVVHMAVYFLETGEATLISSGAVWLDSPVENQAEGIDRLQNLVLANVDAVRPAIRQRLGLPPLP